MSLSPVAFSVLNLCRTGRALVIAAHRFMASHKQRHRETYRLNRVLYLVGARVAWRVRFGHGVTFSANLSSRRTYILARGVR